MPFPLQIPAAKKFSWLRANASGKVVESLKLCITIQWNSFLEIRLKTEVWRRENETTWFQIAFFHDGKCLILKLERLMDVMMKVIEQSYQFISMIANYWALYGRHLTRKFFDSLKLNDGNLSSTKQDNGKICLTSLEPITVVSNRP